MPKNANISADGFQIGDIYLLSGTNSTEMIPRCEISYVSAKYKSNRLLLLIGIIFAIFGLYNSLAGVGGQQLPIVFIVFGFILIFIFFVTRKVGIIIASSGGQLFIETRGKSRFALLEEIHADLRARSSTTSPAPL